MSTREGKGIEAIEARRIGRKHRLFAAGRVPLHELLRHLEPLPVGGAQGQHRPVAAPHDARGAEAGEHVRNIALELRDGRAGGSLVAVVLADGTKLEMGGGAGSPAPGK